MQRSITVYAFGQNMSKYGKLEKKNKKYYNLCTCLDKNKFEFELKTL